MSRASGSDRDGSLWRASGLLGRAGIGAGVTVLLSAVPVIGLVAPVIGGGVAGWANRDGATDGIRVGAAAGGLVALLSVPLTFVAVAVAAAVSPLATVAVLAAALVTAVYVVGSAALGGYVADDIASKRESRSVRAEPPVERLKRRYVDGDIDDEEFERRLETLVETDRKRGGGKASDHRDDRSETEPMRERDR